MEIYIAIYILLMLSVVFANSNKGIYIFFVILFPFLIGFRSIDVGADTSNYMDIYRIINNNGYNGYPEPLFGGLCLFFSFFGFNFNWFQTIVFLILFLIISIPIFKECRNNLMLCLSCLYLMYFVFYAMNINRQIISCFILLYGFYILNKDVKKYILIVIVATFIHSSSIFALAIVLFRKIDLDTRRIWLMLASTFLIGLVLNNSIIEIFIGKYASYLAEGARDENRLVLSIFLSIYWQILYLLMYHTINVDDRNNNYLKILLLSILFNNLLLKQELGLRVFLLFSIVGIIIIPFYIDRNKLSRGLSCSIALGYLSFFFFVFLFNNSAKIVPYKFCFGY